MTKHSSIKRGSQERNELIGKRENGILDAAMKVFAEKGFQYTDVEKIADLAGVGKGTVYRYFKSKENLFLSAVEWGLKALKKRVIDAVSKSEGSVDKLKVALFTYLMFFEENRDFYKVFIEEMTRVRLKVEREWQQRHISYVHLMVNILEDILRQGMREGVFKKVNATSAAHTFWGMSNAVMYRWLTSSKPYPIKRELSMIEEIYLSGILTYHTK